MNLNEYLKTEIVLVFKISLDTDFPFSDFLQYKTISAMKNFVITYF